MLTRGRKARKEDAVLPEKGIKDSFVLEFLDLKDEYSESDLEEVELSWRGLLRERSQEKENDRPINVRQHHPAHRRGQDRIDTESVYARNPSKE